MAVETSIYILGAGAIGIALGVNLILHNRNVLMVRTSNPDISETTTRSESRLLVPVALHRLAGLSPSDLTDEDRSRSQNETK